VGTREPLSPKVAIFQRPYQVCRHIKPERSHHAGQSVDHGCVVARRMLSVKSREAPWWPSCQMTMPAALPPLIWLPDKAARIFRSRASGSAHLTGDRPHMTILKMRHEPSQGVRFNL
jgi:hypothetical protein